MVKRTCEEIEKKVIKLYNDGIGTMKLAKRFGFDRSTIQRILLRNRVVLRKSRDNHFDHDRYFFSKFNEKSCYWAGFIAADGYIKNKNEKFLHIKLCRVDKDHLEKFLKIIKATNPIHDSNDNANYSYINIHGKSFVKDLYKNFGITNKKSLTIKFPENIPHEFIPHFIRGYFDGDGSVWENSNYNRSGINIVGTENMLDFMRNYFYYALGIRIQSNNKVPPFNPAGKNFIITYGDTNASKILYHLYNNSTEETRLSRKYKKYLTLFNEMPRDREHIIKALEFSDGENE